MPIACKINMLFPCETISFNRYKKKRYEEMPWQVSPPLVPPRLESIRGSSPSHGPKAPGRLIRSPLGLRHGFTGWSWAGPISRKPLWSWWDTTAHRPVPPCQRDICSTLGQVPLSARTPREAEEHSPGKTRGSLAPACCTDMPDHPLQPRLFMTLYRSLLGRPTCSLLYEAGYRRF